MDYDLILFRFFFFFSSSDSNPDEMYTHLIEGGIS